MPLDPWLIDTTTGSETESKSNGVTIRQVNTSTTSSVGDILNNSDDSSMQREGNQSSLHPSMQDESDRSRQIDSNAATNQKTTSDDLNSIQPLQQQEILTVTLHISASNSCVVDAHETTTSSLPARTDMVRVMLIPITGLEQREKEMIQTAQALHIPPSRWNGSLLYNLYQQQQQQQQLASGTKATTEHPDTNSNTLGESNNKVRDSGRRILLCLYQDSDMKWSTTPSNKSDAITLSTMNDTAVPVAAAVSSSSWFGTCVHKNIDFDWIQTYYVTGRITIPSNARGYDVLWLLEYFQLMYQPDQFHFANYATYTRVQLWSKYYCYLRPVLSDWIIDEICKRKELKNDEKRFPLLFGTTSSYETSMELGTDHLMPLGDTSVPTSHSTNHPYGSSKRSLADRAFKLFNSKACIEAINARSGTSNSDHHPDYRHHGRSGSGAAVDEAHSQTTVPCQEERTTAEIRQDFCRYLQYRLMNNNDHDKNDAHSEVWNIQFTVRPITVHYTEESTVPDDTNGTNSNSSSGSIQITNDNSVGTTNTPKKHKTLHQKYMVAHRAVLIIDQQPSSSIVIPSEFDEFAVTTLQKRHPPIATDLSAPLEELVEEEIAKGRLENLLQQVGARNNKSNGKDERRVTINENVSYEKENQSTRLIEESKSYDLPVDVGITKRTEPLDLNVPHDELNASMDASFNASIGIFPSSPTTKKKKKPKPVFVLPEKLLDGDDNNYQGIKDLERMKTPIVKSTPIIGSKNNDGLSLPGPITIVRKGTFDNTVTSALTGPFYVDENGVLRDVFENCDDESDDVYEGHEDTRAQARRHEWIQTSLLNRGITERMEILLKEDSHNERTSKATSTTSSFDPWDWLSGINVCEFSRDVIKSVENYANCVIYDSSIVANMSPTNSNEKIATGTALQVTKSGLPTTPDMLASQNNTIEALAIEPIAGNVRSKNSSTLPMDEQSRDEEPIEHIVENIILTKEMDNREGSFGSHSSKDSPRGVQRFDSVSSADKLTTQPSSDVTDVLNSQSGTDDTPRTTKTTPDKKVRGIKGLFRRKKVDHSITKRNDAVTK